MDMIITIITTQCLHELITLHPITIAHLPIRNYLFKVIML